MPAIVSQRRVLYPLLMDNLYVLLVEDNPDDADLTMIALKVNKFPYRVDVMQDGAQALSFLHGKTSSDLPALVVLDLNLPKVSGLEVLKEIRSDARLAALPVVILTSSSQESDMARARALGVQDYLLKVVDFSAFDAVVSRLRDIIERVPHRL